MLVKGLVASRWAVGAACVGFLLVSFNGMRMDWELMVTILVSGD